MVPLDTGRLFHDVLLGVQFLHSRNWLHGDLKPDNIGIDMNPPRAILLDFGCAHRCYGNLAPIPGVGGTVAYLSPERYVDLWGFSADIWALGVIGYELSFGNHPWAFSEHPYQPGGPHNQQYLADLRRRYSEKYQQGIHKLKEAKPVGPNQLDCT